MLQTRRVHSPNCRISFWHRGITFFRGNVCLMGGKGPAHCNLHSLATPPRDNEQEWQVTQFLSHQERFQSYEDVSEQAIGPLGRFFWGCFVVEGRVQGLGELQEMRRNQFLTWSPNCQGHEIMMNILLSENPGTERTHHLRK